MAFQTGATLGRYTLLKRLASSGGAETLLARASGAAGFEHHVVIKRMRAEPGASPEAVSRFLDELRLAGSLHHHHIVQVHDAGKEGNDYYFAMEYVHGEDLRKILTRVVKRNETIPLDHVVTIGIAIAQALHHAHEQRGQDGQPLGLVHRDVSPANVIVGYDGTVKVVDFGVAKAAGRNVQTHVGQLRGKAPYMAPEQCAGRPLDRRADIFALGIVLWELVTAKRLFKGQNDFMTMAAIVSGKVVPPSKLRAELPADFEQIIMKALTLSPDGRYANAIELAHALEDMATNNIIRISQAALATYLKSLFGTRPEPWLVEDEDNTNVEGLDVDFDGDTGGVVRVTKEQVMNLDAVREVMQAQEIEQEAAEEYYDEDEFDEEPMTELVDHDIALSNVTDYKEIAAAVEAAKLLRPSAAHAVVPPPVSDAFEGKTAVADGAEVDRLRRLSAQMPAMAEPPPRPTPPPLPRPVGSQPPPNQPASPQPQMLHHASADVKPAPLAWDVGVTVQEPTGSLRPRFPWTIAIVAIIVIAAGAVLVDLLL